MNMTVVLHSLIDIGVMVGTVDGVHMYSKDFMSVEGKAADGKKFSITISIKEEVNNGN